MAGRLAGKTAIITGAGQGIGEAIARRFSLEGCQIVIAERNETMGEAVAQSLRDAGHEAVAVPTDVSDQGAVQTMVAKAHDTFGKLDILINNAGIAVFNDPLTLTLEEWRRCFAVDLDGVWFCCQAVLPHLLKQGGGSIVNIGSTHAFQIIPGCYPYPVAKHGLVGLTRALAIEYARKGIRVNDVSPGYIETPVTLEYWQSFPDPEAERSRAYNLIPMGRTGTPEEVAAAVLFLASDEASFITGTSLIADGGRSVLHHE
jgi:NAD(P)-dependent dehydrogenase (short-subunit alcohol dehydrogenase family)